MAGMVKYYVEHIETDSAGEVIKLTHLGLLTIKELRRLMVKKNIKVVRAFRYVEQSYTVVKKKVLHKVDLEITQIYELKNGKAMRKETQRKTISEPVDS